MEIPEKIPHFASEFSIMSFSRGPKNKKFNLWRCSCRSSGEFKN